MVAPLTDASPLLFSKLNLTCLSTGDPTPVTYWTKDGSTNVPRATFSQDNATLTIDQVQLEDDGFYMCFVENRAGNTSSSAKVEVLGKATFFCSCCFNESNIVKHCSAYFLEILHRLFF